MKKKIESKLSLSRETLRALNPGDLSGAAGGGPTTTISTNTSNSVATCDSCFGPEC